MKNKSLVKSLSALMLGGALLGTTNFATAEEVTPGDRELQVSLSSFKAVGSDIGTVAGEVTYGKYVTPNWLLGVTQGINYSFIEGADDIWSASTIGFADYHFSDHTSDFVPFAGVTY